MLFLDNKFLPPEARPVHPLFFDHHSCLLILINDPTDTVRNAAFGYYRPTCSTTWTGT